MKTSSHRDKPSFVSFLIGFGRSCRCRCSKKIVRPLAFVAVISGALTYAGCTTTPVPTDPITTGCSVSATEFNTWFESGAVSLNGVAKPANSVTFSNSPNCDFYKWSEQMFVWVTSPAPPTYGGGAHIFDSAAFFDVSPPDSIGHRTLVPHTSGLIRNLGLRAAQAGAHDLPVIFDKEGRMFEIQDPKLGPNNKPLILNEKNEQVEIEHIRIGEDKKPIFLDKTGNAIQRARPIIAAELAQTRIVEKFVVDSIPVFLDPFGNVIDMDQGQAQDRGVLEAVNGSLVYYTTMVNDVWAYFVTGTKNGGILPAPTQFPTNQTQLNQVINFAAAHGKTFPDPEALAIEIKTAWVEASGVPNLNTYITMTASIPTYDRTNPDHWVPTGQRTVQLALVGIHVVGSTAGHPEMVWATFEHKANTPNDTYEYVSTSGTKTVNPDFSLAYLFCAASPDPAHLNDQHMIFNSPNIDNVPPFHNTPSNTIRRKAWGGAFNVSPNPLDANTAASNSEIISINNNVRGMLDSADVRNNYIFTGATWTIGGAGPTGSFPSGNEVGTSKLENTTMETYQQGTTKMFNTGANCFNCHLNNTVHVSHMFTPVQPLF
jgi:hypothetical protein